MLKSLLTQTLGLLLLLQGAEHRIYVDPFGNDAGSGTAEQPVASIQAALDKAAARSNRPVVVVLKDGCYRINNPLFLEAQHSGITLRAENAGNAVISGGQEITGWQQISNGLWSANVPAGTDFKQLFINGARKTRARTPNTGWYYGAGAYNPSKVTDLKYRENYNRFYFKTGQFNGVLSSEVSNTYVTVFHAWTTSLHGITNVDYTTNLVYLESDTRHPITRWTSDIRFIIENYRAALDAPGEWYLDTPDGKVYYIPEEGEQITNAITPTVSNLLLFAGTANNPVTNVTVKGIVFEHCNWDVPRTNSADGQLGRSMRSYAVHGDYLKNSVITNCVFRHLGADAVWLEDGCRDVLIQKNHFYDIGGSALKVGPATDESTISAAELTQRITVDNNLIHDCGIIFHGGCGIGVLNSADNVVSHNEISDMDYTGISVGWGWSTAAGSATNNLIAHNHIHHLGRDVLSDMAGIYLPNKSPGTAIRNNIIHDVDCYEYGGHGLYADAYGCYMLFESNLVYRTESAGLMRNMGWDNTARNNIFAYCGYLYQSGLAGTNTPAGHTNFDINCNISYCNGTNQFYRAVDATHPVQMDYNLYWNTPTNIMFGSNTFVQWTDSGHDTHSRITDPLFVNPLADNFILQSNSPAFTKGFHAIDYAVVGLYGDAAWKGLAKTLVHAFPVTSTESSYIAADNRDVNYSGSTYNGRCLWNGSGNLKRVIYYRFNLPANISTVVAAALKLGVTTNCSEGNSYSVVAITNETTEADWTEGALTWNNAPAHNTNNALPQAWNTNADPNPFVLADTVLAASVKIPAGTPVQTTFSIPLNANGLAMINQDTDHSVTFMVVVNDRSTNAPGFYLSNTAIEDCRPKLVLSTKAPKVILYSEDFQSFNTGVSFLGTANAVGWTGFNMGINQTNTVGGIGSPFSSDTPVRSWHINDASTNVAGNETLVYSSTNSGAASISNTGNIKISFDFNVRSNQTSQAFPAFDLRAGNTQVLSLNFFSASNTFNNYVNGAWQGVSGFNGVSTANWYRVEITIGDLSTTNDTYNLKVLEAVPAGGYNQAGTLVLDTSNLACRVNNFACIDGFDFRVVTGTKNSLYNIDNILVEENP